MTHGLATMEREQKMLRLPKFCPVTGKELLVTKTPLRFDIYSGQLIRERVTLKSPDLKNASGLLGKFSTVDNSYYDRTIIIENEQVVEGEL